MSKNVLGILVVAALLAVAVVGVASAQGPWWTQEDGEGVPPRASSEFECPEDCPFDGEAQGRNFVDENNDGINDNAGQMGRWFEDEDAFGPGMMARRNQGQENFGPRMGGRWSEGDSEFQMPCQMGGRFGPGMMQGKMGQQNPQCDGDCENEGPSRNFQNGEGMGRGMGRGQMM